MKYFWVNQSQTFQHEYEGGYLWSPKTNSNGARNRSYEMMREVSPGDVIFSFAGTYIKAVGVAASHCYECPKPTEFGSAGEYWSKIGWRVDVVYRRLGSPFRPRDHMSSLGPHLPPKYSPLRGDGQGNQNFYLLQLNVRLASEVARLIDRETVMLLQGKTVGDYEEVYETSKIGPKAGEDPAFHFIEKWEDDLEESIKSDPSLEVTEKEQVIKARKGQGLFRKKLFGLEKECRITKVDRYEFLVASHTKPWRDCESSDERLDPENGFMMTRSIDYLFDRGFISFENGGDLIVSPVADPDSLKKMGVPVDRNYKVGSFSQGQKKYLDWHREKILLKSMV